MRDANKQARRGRLTKGGDDGLDLGLAVREISEGRAMLIEAYKMPRCPQRVEAIKQALAKVQLGAGFANHVVERRSGGKD